MTAREKREKVQTAVVFALAVAGGIWGRHLTVESQMPILEGLRTTASIIFTVVGIWLALIYPDILQSLSHWYQGVDRESERLNSLLRPLIDSIWVVITVSVIAVARPLLSQLQVTQGWLDSARGACFGMIVCLTIILLQALLAMTKPMFDLHKKIRRDEDFSRARSKFPPPVDDEVLASSESRRSV